jgi:cytochrome P450
MIGLTGMGILVQFLLEQRRVADESRDVEITPDNAMAAMPHLIHTRAVISEALRLYPPAFAIAREAIGKDRIGAIDIPRGTVLLIAPWVLHRHQRLWRDADAFDPSRFLRIHRSAIVRIDKIKELQPWFHGEYHVILENGKQLTLSRNYRANLQEAVGKAL